jgi:N-acetylglucosamine malate deacetylase 1
MSKISALYPRLKHAILWRVVAPCRDLMAYVERCRFNWFIKPKMATLNHIEGAALVFAPHQDDETLGCGGLIALKRQQNIPVNVAFLTDGSACYESIALQGATVMASSEIVPMRQAEAIAALGHLGVEPSNIHFLDQADQFLGELSDSAHQALVDRVVSLIQTVAPQHIYVTYRDDVHSDHQASYRVVRDALAQSQQSQSQQSQSQQSIQLWEYPIWTFWNYQRFSAMLRNKQFKLCRLPIHTVHTQKQAALQCYRSQYEQLPGTFSPVLSAGFMKYLSSVSEVFVRQI